MTTYRESIEEIGAMAGPGEDLVIAMLPNGGRIRHYVATNLAEQVIDETTNVYLASGTFAAGTVNEHGGRSEENLRTVIWMPFDADLTDYTSFDDTYLHELDQAELDTMIDFQRADLERVFREVGMRIHRLDYTGYGLCAYLYLEPVEVQHVGTVKDVHKALIKRINDHAGFKLVDVQVSDAGTRITRLPGTMNVKNPAMPRLVRTLSHQKGQQVTLDELRFAERSVKQEPRKPGLPESKQLPGKVADEIVAAIAAYWTQGQKHAMALGMAGILAKAGVPEEQTLAIIERLSADDQKPWDRQRCVRDTYARLRTGADTRGYSSLAEMLPPSVVAYVTERLDRVKQATTFTFKAGPQGKKEYETSSEQGQSKIDRAIAAEFPPAPMSAYYGWFGDYRDLMAPTTEAPDVFHLGSSLALASAMIGRRICADYASDELFANLYVALVGASGSSRKDTAMKRATRMSSLYATHRQVNPVFGIQRDITSAEGLVKQLKDTPNLLIYNTELTGLLKNTKRQSTSSLLDRLIEAWDTPPTMQNLSKHDPMQAKNPYLTILSATQPGRLAIEMTAEEINSGFANRWMYFAGAGKPAMPRPPSLDKKAAWELYLNLNDCIMSYTEGMMIALSPDANERWDAWYERTSNAVLDNENHQVLSTRHATIIHKIALIFAVSDRSSAIEDHHLAAAIDLVDWMWVLVKQLSATWGVSVQTRIEERILSAIRRRGPQKRWKLQQVTASSEWSQREFSGAIESMLKNETIVRDAEGFIGLNPEMRAAA